MSPALRRLLFATVTLLWMAAAAELLLQLIARASPRVALLLSGPGELPERVFDAKLGVRNNPAFPGHDRNGFRNVDVPAHADLVALGDSQTYGTGVAAEEAWPRRLQALRGAPVYGLACGSYGPVHSLLLWDEAMALHPAIALEALYAGNDLYDAWSLVYEHGQRVDLKSSEAEVQQQLAKAEQRGPLSRLVEQRFVALFGAPPDLPGAQAATPAPAWWGRRLSRSSKLAGLWRRTRFELGRAAARRDPWTEATTFAAGHPGVVEIFDDGRFRTLLTPSYRAVALDLEDPRIAEGHRLALRAIGELSRAAAARGVRFAVLLLPTKEQVFYERVQQPSPALRAQVEAERRFAQLTREALQREGIELIDALPALRGVFAGGVSPYPVSSDGHPNAAGHEAIARAVALALGQPPAARR